MVATTDGFLLGNGNRGGLTVNLQSDLISTKCGHMSLSDTRRGHTVQESTHPAGTAGEPYHSLILLLVSLPSSRNLRHAGNMSQFEPS